MVCSNIICLYSLLLHISDSYYDDDDDDDEKVGINNFQKCIWGRKRIKLNNNFYF